MYLIILSANTLITANIDILESNITLRKDTDNTPLLTIVRKSILRLLSSTTIIRIIYTIYSSRYTYEGNSRRSRLRKLS